MIEITKTRTATIKENVGRIVLSEDFTTMIIQGQSIPIEKADMETLKGIILKYVPSVTGFVEYKEVAAVAEAPIEKP